MFPPQVFLAGFDITHGHAVQNTPGLVSPPGSSILGPPGLFKRRLLYEVPCPPFFFSPCPRPKFFMCGFTTRKFFFCFQPPLCPAIPRVCPLVPVQGPEFGPPTQLFLLPTLKGFSTLLWSFFSGGFSSCITCYFAVATGRFSPRPPASSVSICN